MMRRSVSSTAERVSDRRSWLLPVLSVTFVAQQASYVLGTGAGTGDLSIANVQIVAWLALSVVMLLVLMTGGAWFQSRAVRALVDDEVTRAHRDRALCLGFVASMGTCMVVYVAAMIANLPGREVAHLAISVGIAVALVRFAMLERRAGSNLGSRRPPSPSESA